MDAVILRCIERILVVCFSGLAIYLGYRLFSQIPDRTDAKGKVVLPGGISIYITRVGPGMFFALFGLIVLSLSLHYSVKIQKDVDPSKESNLSQSASSEVIYRGFNKENKSPDINTKDVMLNMRPDMFQLNNLISLLRSDIGEEERGDVERLIKRIKLNMLYGVWKDEWGDFNLFKEWCDGFSDELPEAQKEAAKLYYHGTSKEIS